MYLILTVNIVRSGPLWHVDYYSTVREITFTVILKGKLLYMEFDKQSLLQIHIFITVID